MTKDDLVSKDTALNIAIEFMGTLTIDVGIKTWNEKRRKEAIQACKEALEQPTQEPMIVKQDNGMVLKLGYEDLPNGTAFYTTPPSREWQSLSDDDISYTWAGFAPDAIDFARAIEAKLKEKNG